MPDSPPAVRHSPSQRPDLPLVAYNALLLVLSPLLMLRKVVKYARRRHAHELDLERWSCPVAHEADSELAGPRVAFVGLGWGEALVIERLDAALRERCPQVQTSWVMRDPGVRRGWQAKVPLQTVAPMPFDHPIPVRRWLRSLRPDVVVLVEKLPYPNLVHGAKNAGAKVLLVNGRSRNYRRLRYRLGAPFLRWVAGAFDCLCWESEEHERRAAPALPPGRSCVTGNVKFGFGKPMPPVNATALEAWLATRGDTPLLIAGSTSRIDEEWVLEALVQVRRNSPCCLLLAPRRPERGQDVEAAAHMAGFTASRRSIAASPEPSDVYILDTLGELAWVYQWGLAAYVGGSIDGAGHNPIEPIVWGVPVCYGPRAGHFESVQRALEAEGCGAVVGSAEELAIFWRRALRDKAWRTGMSRDARTLLEAQSGAMKKTMASLCRLLEECASRAT